MNKFSKILCLFMVVSFSLVIFSGPLSHASSPDPSVANIQPLGTAISGTYDFKAKVTISAGYAVNSVTFHIDGSTYSGSLYSSQAGKTVSVFDYKYAFVSGTLANGAYTWYASASTTAGSASSGATSFTVSNSVILSAISPVSGETIHGNRTFSVAASTTSSNTVSSITLHLDSSSYSLVNQGSNQWSYTLDTGSIPPGPFDAVYDAVGTGSITGTLSVPITITHTGSTLWSVDYRSAGQDFSESVSPFMQSTYSTEGNFIVQEGSFTLYPNSDTTQIALTKPETLSGLQAMWFPGSQTPYYTPGATLASNFGTGYDNLTYTSGDLYNNSMGFNALNATAAVTSQSALVTSSNSAFTVGGFFKINSITNANSYFFGNSPDSSFAAVQEANNTFNIQFALATATNTFTLTSNAFLPYHKWFSVFLTYNGSYNAYVDGQEFTLSGTPSAGALFGSTVIPAGASVDTFQIASFSSAVSSNQISNIALPLTWQISSSIQPPFYSVTENYYTVTIVNNTQPWSSTVGVSVLELQTSVNSQVSASYTSPIGQQNFINYNMTVEYTPYFSLRSFTFNPLYSQFGIPLGSTYKINVSDVFGIVVGTLTGTVESTTVSLSIVLDVSDLTFQFVNNNGFNEISVYYGNANNSQQTTNTIALVVANNTEYHYSTTVYINNVPTDYNGTINVSQPHTVAYIVTAAPAASISISVKGYSASQTGYIQYSSPYNGLPFVYLYINGQLEPIGTTYITQLYKTLNITVKDALNQTVYQDNYTVLSTLNSIQANITIPSYSLSIINLEQKNKTAPTKNTEVVTVTNRSDNASEQYLNSIGTTLVLYLKNGSYSVSVQDNITAQWNVVLNSTQSFYLQGQNVLNQTQFDNKINKVLQNLSANSYVQVTPLISPSQGFPNQKFSDVFKVTFLNGTLLSVKQRESLILNSSFTLVNVTSKKAVSATLQVSGNNITANFTLTGSGYYSLSWVGYGNFSGSLHGLSYGSELEVLSHSAVGLQIQVSGPQSFEVNTTANFIALVSYTNGTAMNASDTDLVLKNMVTSSVYYEGNFYGLVHPYYIQAGKIGIKVNESKIGVNYVLDVVVSTFTLNGTNVSALVPVSFTVLSYNPTTQSWFDTFLNGLAGGIYKISLYLGIPITIGVFFWYVYKFIRRKKIRAKRIVRGIKEAVEGDILKDSLTPQQKKQIVQNLYRDYGKYLERGRISILYENVKRRFKKNEAQTGSGMK